ncbi:MAG: amino acid ABC transporter ATP-binding protein [Zavarzinella sp.]
MITIEQLNKFRGTNQVLKNIHLRVEKGDVIGMIGPSGGGKSTLLRCINALESFASGTIQVGDLTISPNDTTPKSTLVQLRRQVGMVFQQFNLFPHMTALQNVMSGPTLVLNQPREQAETLARELLTRVGLSHRLQARPEEMSGGQQQRVAIARALAVKPEVILFDEPTSALDPKMAEEVLGVISELAAAGQTMLIVTHAMDFARKVAKRLIVMEAGEITRSGPPEEILP